MSGVRLERVSKVFDDGTTAVDDVSLEIRDGEFMVLVGPSGCGKSTLLRMIAGLESVTAGGVEIGGRDVTDAPPKDRDTAMVFQNYALYPHMTVRQNIGFGMRIRGASKQAIRASVDEVAQTLGLTDQLERHPSALSGGQRQRVAIGRAMIREPAVYLMDEPLSNLDAKLRVNMRAELARLHERLGVTTIYVTHDQTEAMTLGDRVAVMRDGELQQCGPPDELYERPANLFVATFMGSPSMNLAHGRVRDGILEFAGFAIGTDVLAVDVADGSDVIVGIRPEDLRLTHRATSSGPGPWIETQVELAESLGSETLILAAVQGEPVMLVDDAATARAEQDIPILADARHALFTVRIPGKASLGHRDRIAVELDADRLHLFDPATGQSLATAVRTTEGV